MEAELLVGHVYRMWTGKPIGPVPGPTIDARQVERALVALDEAAARWDALADGESITMVWPLTVPRGNA